MLNCIIEGTLSEVAIEMGKERKIITKKTDAAEGTRGCKTLSPHPAGQDEVTSALRRFRQLRAMRNKHLKIPDMQ